jgi:hypothetical protein
LPRTIKVKFPRMNGQGFADPRAGVVEEEQERPIACPGRGLRVHGGYDRASLLRFEICCYVESGPLGRESEDSAVLFSTGQIVA